MGRVSKFTTALFAALAILLVLGGINGSSTAGARLAQGWRTEGSIIFIHWTKDMPLVDVVESGASRKNEYDVQTPPLNLSVTASGQQTLKN